MQLTQLTPSVSAQNPSVFKFGQNEIRVFERNKEPWFVATDIAKCLGIKNPKDAVKNLRQIERWGFNPQRGGSLTLVSESGLYTMILRSDSAIKEGTPAFNFRVWVTDDLLPTLRKTGSYSCPIATITPSQQLRLREAVAKRAQAVASHYQTIYRALYTRFQIPRYSDLLAKDFEAAIEFIRTVDLRVPEVRKTEVTPAGGDGRCPHCGLRPLPQGAIVLGKNDAEKLRGLVYEMKYLHRKQLESFYGMLASVRSPLAASFYETMNNMAIDNVEHILERNGYSVKELDCYKHLFGIAR